MLGSNPLAASRYTGDYTPLPAVYQAAFRYGIRFFELRFPKPSENSQCIFGPLDVRVTEDLVEGSMKVRYSVNVLRGVQAKIRYETYDNKGTSLAFMFDDLYWMNRVFLMDNPWMYAGIYAMHTRDGLVPGSLVKMEIDCLREVITEDKPIWKVMQPNGREACFFWTEREAKIELTPARRDAGWEIVEGVKRDKKTPIMQIIQRNRALVDGWTSAPEFQEKWVPQVKMLIQQRQKSFVSEGDVRTSPNDIQAMVTNALLNMDPAVLRDIAEKAEQRKASSQARAQEAIETGTAEDVEFTFTESGLNAKTVEELRSIASQLGITRPEKIKKVDLIAKIMETQNVPMQQQPDVLDVDEEVIAQ